MLSSSPLKLRNDPVTFEVLRHRLWQINDEQGKTIIRVSGSPVATEGNDFNVAIADAAGELVGGLFYFNYPGGSGLMSGTVFGKIAGASAGRAGKN